MAQPISQKQIDEFIALFNGDATAAIQTLRDYSPSLKVADKHTAEPTAPLLIRVENLSKEYTVGHQKVRALHDVSLTIHEGEFVAITAPSGSGKSTLLQLMGGLEKPTNGVVTVRDVNINKLHDAKLSQFRGQTIGFIFQFFYLQPFLTLEQNLEVPSMFAHLKHKERQERIKLLAQTVGIADRLKHLPKELSGGQIQRAAVARALMNRPKVILADEPTGNLDTSNSSAIIDLFEDIRKQFGTTIVIATHDPAVASRADRVIKLQDGALL